MALGDRFSRQKSMIGTCVAIIVLGFIYSSLRDQMEITIAGFALVTAIYTLVTLGLYAYIPELFPTEYRLRGTGVAGVSGRAVSITTPYLTVYLFEHFGVQGVLGMVTAMLVALCAAILILGVETAKVSLDDNGAFGDEDELAAAAAAMLHE